MIVYGTLWPRDKGHTYKEPLSKAGFRTCWRRSSSPHWVSRNIYCFTLIRAGPSSLGNEDNVECRPPVTGVLGVQSEWELCGKPQSGHPCGSL